MPNCVPFPPAPRRRRFAALLLACAFTLPGIRAAAAADNAESPSEPAAAWLTTAFGETRSADSDLLVLRDGRRLAGQLLNGQFTLRTGVGSISFEAAFIAGIQLAGPTEAATTILGVNNDQFSGVLDPLPLELRSAEGPTIALRSEAVRRVIRRGSPGEADSLPVGQFIVLKNGDRFAARIATIQFTVVVDETNRVVSLAGVDTIGFTADHPAAARIALRDGSSFGAAWPGDDLELVLAAGPTLRVYRDWVALIHAQPGFRPPEYRVGTTGGAQAGRPLAGMVWVAPGRFVMGSPTEEVGRDFDEAPLTEVTLTRGFWMGAHEVTQAEYKAVTGANPSQFVSDPGLPVERVNWREAVAYCEELTRRWAADGRLPKGYAFRLPTEAEWEYTCRAGSTTRFSHGDDPDGRRLGEFAWFGENSDSTSHPVGRRRSNPWGFYDLSGNVLEWCQDSAGAYPGGSVTNYVAQSGRGLLRVARGGSWLYGANAARSANRDTYTETTRCSDLGFRVVLAPVAEDGR